MAKFKLHILLLFLAFIPLACKEKSPNFRKNTIPNSKLIDFKKDQYKIELDQNLNEINFRSNWRWNAEMDSDGKCDSKGEDQYINMEQQLIHFNDHLTLPSLFISTNKNIIESFTYSLPFLMGKTTDSLPLLFEIIDDDIVQLQQKELLDILLTTGFHHQERRGIQETFELKKNNGEGFDNFIYTMKKVD